MNESDAQLIAGYLSGDAAAVETVDAWIQQASSRFRRRLGENWDDQLQDIRLELTHLFQAGKFRGDSSLKTYLWKVASHACLDRLRALSKRHWDDVESPHLEGVLSMPARQGRVREENDLCLRVLRQVPEECHRLWQMIFEGYSYREMSRRLSVAEGTLRVRVLRCRKRAVEIRERLLGGAEE